MSQIISQTTHLCLGDFKDGAKSLASVEGQKKTTGQK